MDCSTPGLPVYHQFPEPTQTHVHWVGDAIQPSHPLSSPSPPTFNLSPASGSFQMSQFFASGGQSIAVSASTSVLQMNTQDWSPLGWTGWLDLLAVQGALKSFLQHLIRGKKMCPMLVIWGFYATNNEVKKGVIVLARGTDPEESWQSK